MVELHVRIDREGGFAMIKAISVWLAMTALTVPDATGAADLGVGDTAPAFSLQGSDGKTHSLSSFAGKRAVVVAWFPKAFTSG